MAWGFFKKRKKEQENELHYDPSNISIRDVRKGFIFDYDLKSWEVKAEYEYDWGNEYFTYEYKIVAADDTAYLYVAEDDELFLSISRKINFAMLPEEVEEGIRNEGRPPKRITYNDVTFFRNSESPGFFKEVGAPGISDEFMSWEYLDETEMNILSIEQWGEEEYAAALGKVVREMDFSNILPA